MEISSSAVPYVQQQMHYRMDVCLYACEYLPR